MPWTFPTSGRNMGLPWRRRRGQGPHLAKRWEPRGFSRVAASKTACLRARLSPHLHTNYTGVKVSPSGSLQVEHSVGGARRRLWRLRVPTPQAARSQARPRAGRLGPARPVPSPRTVTAGLGAVWGRGRDRASRRVAGKSDGWGSGQVYSKRTGQALRRQGLAAGPLGARRKGWGPLGLEVGRRGCPCHISGPRLLHLPRTQTENLKINQ